jgi:hypothetical protein
MKMYTNLISEEKVEEKEEEELEEELRKKKKRYCTVLYCTVKWIPSLKKSKKKLIPEVRHKKVETTHI